MVAALEASICSDVAAAGGGSAAEDGVDGMVLHFKSLSRKELQGLCKQNKLKANDTLENMAAAMEAFRCSAVPVAGVVSAALEAFRCSAVAVADDGSAAEDDNEEVEDDEG